jgi:hypothetical protein
MTEIPREQPSRWLEDFDRNVNIGSLHYERLWAQTDIDPGSIHTVVQFGPGVGLDTAIYLNRFQILVYM